ncbi:MAG: zinc-ribbon domain-containing protein [Candidatus Thorarchaeota archaeon]
MYCQNCGSEIGQNDLICPFCGQRNGSSEVLKEKDNKIQELEQKIAKLESIIKEEPKSIFKKAGLNHFQPWIFIFPIVFVILFFVLFIILVKL